MKKPSKTIVIREEFRTDYISRGAGERLRLEILTSCPGQERIEIDFSGLKIGSASFFDEGIAKLKDEGWSRDDLKQKIIFQHLHPLD